MKSFAMKSSRLILLAICAFVCLCCVPALAQDEQAQADKAGKKEILTDLEQRMQKQISIDVNDVPIGTVVRQLADQANVDLIKSPLVIGNVTVSLTDVSLEEALRSILTVHGADYIAGENVIRILSRDEMPQISERLITETFQIVHVDVAEVVKALEKFKSAQGSVSYIEGTSHVIVTDTESKVRDITNLLYKIDGVTPQILVEARIYDITSKNNLDLGIEWGAGRRTNLSSGSIINDDIVVEKGGSDTYVGSRTDPALMAGFSGPADKTAATTSGFLRFGILTDHVDIDARLRAEQENIDAKLLANPRILVLDNQEATFDIVTEHPYVERTITSSGITETIKFKNVGVSMIVTPHITSNKTLRLHIVPEFSVLVERVTVSSSNVPVIDTRKFDTTAVVKDGHTVVLGGLRKRDTSQQTNKVPLLGDIPVIGNLFKFQGEATVTNELVIFITPRIMEELEMTADEQEAYSITGFRGPKPNTTKAEKKMTGQ
ncbi:MAG: secretin N-terminal domain-containing protein [Planctomycetota bacterium]